MDNKVKITYKDQVTVVPTAALAEALLMYGVPYETVASIPTEHGSWQILNLDTITLELEFLGAA